MYKKVLCNGSGNTFVLIHKIDFGTINLSPKQIQRLCLYKRAHGTDGLLLISTIKAAQYLLNYYNCDGTWESLCINGSLCSARYMKDHFIVDKQFTFKAGDGIHTVRSLNNMLEVSICPPKKTKENINIAGFTGSLIDSGAKHFCIIVNKLDESMPTTLGPIIRNDYIFKPGGVNVNFIKIINKNTIEVFTYEKGVEKFMQSCGSGAAAAVYYAYEFLKNKRDSLLQIQSPCTIITPGGRFTARFNGWSDFYISGPTEISPPENLDVASL